MPQSARRACRKPQCGELVDSGYCETHRQAETKQREQWRGSSSHRGYGHKHRKVRDQTLRRDGYLCLRCLEQGKIVPATDSHHIKKMGTHPELHLDPNNRRSLCRGCHEIEEKKAI